MTHPETPEGPRLGGLRWITRSSPARSLAMLGGGCVLGLLIAGSSLFSARGTIFAVVPPEAVALVNDKPILFTDFINQLQSEYGDYGKSTPEQRRKVLDEMISEELTVQRGVELDLPGTSGDVRAALVNAVELQVDANVLAARPSEADLRAYYLAHQERYATNGLLSSDELWLPGAHPGAADMARAQAAAAALKRGEDAMAVANRLGLRQLDRVSNETFDLTAKLKLGDAIYHDVAPLHLGEVAGPVAVADGLHILRVKSRTPPTLPPFETAMATVFGDYQRDARAPVDAANRKFLRARARVLLAPGFRE